MDVHLRAKFQVSNIIQNEPPKKPIQVRFNNTTHALKICFSANSRICWHCKNRNCKGAEITAIVVAEKPTSWFICLNETSDWFIRSWHFEMICSFFCNGRDTIIVRESMSTPRNYIWWQGLKTDFWKFITNRRFCNTKINVSLDIMISFSKLPIIMMSSR